ncbi:HAD-superfamily hydrolase, subfamily IA, variant 3 [Citrifermentans bremense]|uniref:HAD-superfamily hydrolase, subfamily IA, variant 3 n=1 Tax=Citrifermentans bremense TaxID=60035 RepID=A0A6S6M312_9BACT|nr:HAD-IA family hydrolase [Citrifermentans bremense]BCG48078.1 HAD-superfamily hydrolase, subfamily IA, variant 3 [Citrifermentans bremense]
MPLPLKIDWTLIDTVLLDMDGTLLDRHFDDHFWLEHVPIRYTEKHGGTIEAAKEKLYRMFRSQENTLNWTDLDYWSEQLGLDIPVLKEELDHLIAVHPFVTEFLLFLRQHGKKTYLVTNAHGKTLNLKLRRTTIGSYFDGIVSAHDLGLPKEDPAFWGKLQQAIPYRPQRTMLGEDSETNLETARLFGIGYLIHVGRFSSTSTPSISERFQTIHYFSELIPRDSGMTVSI